MAARYDVIVVGAGHAGCEAALAAARMGCRTAAFTLSRNTVALMPCNPSVGGPGKGHLVREIDALGGEMARNTDRTSVQIRMLNTGKGPAVQSLRAQSDKHAYSAAMRQAIEGQAQLDLVEAAVDDLILDVYAGSPQVAGIRTADGTEYEAPTVILTTGTFLKGRIIVGDESYPGGRAGEFPADALSQSLARAGFTLGRLKTGTPPRLARDSIDFSQTSVQHGSDIPLFLSHDARRAHEQGRTYAPTAEMPIIDLISSTFNVQRSTRWRAARNAEHGTRLSELRTQNPEREQRNQEPGTRNSVPWRDQLDCFLIHTNAATHEIIRQNLDRAPMYNGVIQATGPRYCPSIEAKIVRFADKPSHQLFLEPEGWHTDEIYVQGANTSLPAEVQLAMLRTIPALAGADIVRVGYAIEYDYIPASQVTASLESKPIRGLFLAGQIIGTTGYEEAGSLGIMAGINAARMVKGLDPIVLRRDQAYIGVLIDDLVTKELDEPYRMHTSQAEYRLLLREGSAEARLSRLGYEIGLLDEVRYGAVRDRLALTQDVLEYLKSVKLTPNAGLNAQLAALGAKPLAMPASAHDALRHVDITVKVLQEVGCLGDLPTDVEREVETIAKYAGYVTRQEAEVERLRRLEHRTIPDGIDYGTINGLRSESREKLERVRPRTVGQASRVGGVAPADVAVLLFYLERQRRSTVLSSEF